MLVSNRDCNAVSFEKALCQDISEEHLPVMSTIMSHKVYDIRQVLQCPTMSASFGQFTILVNI